MATPIKIVGISPTGPGIYSLDELRATQTALAKQIWSTIRTDEEAEMRVREWLIKSKHLDDYSIRKLPAFAVLRWLEEEVRQPKPSVEQTEASSRVAELYKLVELLELKYPNSKFKKSQLPPEGKKAYDVLAKSKSTEIEQFSSAAIRFETIHKVNRTWLKNTQESNS